MRSKIYAIGIIAVVILLGLGFQLLPSPWQGGAAGWFSALWYVCALAAGLGYWYKFDFAKAKESRQTQLAQALRAKETAENMTRNTRARAY